MTLIVVVGLGALAIAALTLAAVKTLPRRARARRDAEMITSKP